MLIDASFGRRTRSVVIMDTDHVILSAIQPEIFNGPGQRADRGDERGGRTMSEGKLIILSGLRGREKTVIRQILERHPDFFFSVSATTRQPRGGERDGVHYHFITPAQFEGMIAGQALLEYNHYASGDYYGTPSRACAPGAGPGAAPCCWMWSPMARFRVLEKLPQAVMVFLAPPSLAELRRRLESRGDTPPDKVEARLKQAHWELAQAPHYTYLVVNDQVDVCVAQVEAIFAGRPGGRSLPL